MTKRALAILLFLLPASTASAQTFSIRGEALIGYEHFLASETFKGVFGSANQPVFGGGVDIGLFKNWFIRVDATHFSKTGQRAFVSNGVAYQLNIPLTVTITPVMFTGGYRANVTKAIAVYVGGGVGSWSHSESTDDPTESFSERKTGYLGLGGVEWRLQKYVAVGLEGQYASVPITPTDSVAAQFNEKNLGGSSAVVRIVVGR